MLIHIEQNLPFHLLLSTHVIKYPLVAPKARVKSLTSGSLHTGLRMDNDLHPYWTTSLYGFHPVLKWTWKSVWAAITLPPTCKWDYKLVTYNGNFFDMWICMWMIYLIKNMNTGQSHGFIQQHLLWLLL